MVLFNALIRISDKSMWEMLHDVHYIHKMTMFYFTKLLSPDVGLFHYFSLFTFKSTLQINLTQNNFLKIILPNKLHSVLKNHQELKFCR